MKAFSIFLFFPLLVFAESSSKAEISFENRFFKDDHNPVTHSTHQDLFTRLETKYKNNSIRFKARVIARTDTHDESRDYLLPEELWAGLSTEKHELKLGYQLFNLSSAEAFYPADIINSRILDSSIKNPGKIGELALSYKYLFANSSFTLLGMPYFQKPVYPQETSHYGITIPVNDPQIVVDNKVENDYWTWQGGAIFNTSIWDTDISVHYINHIDRSQPSYVTSLTASGYTATPRYLPVEQTGITFQRPVQSFLFKGEFVFRNFDENSANGTSQTHRDHVQYSLGLERTSAFDFGSEITLLAEYQRIELPRSFLSGYFFQNDLLIGARYAFNDTSSKEILLTVITDLEYDNQHLYNLNYSQRIYEDWKIDTGIQFVDALRDPNYIGIDSIDKTDHFFLNLTKYF